jgi:hypothetical protein
MGTTWEVAVWEKLEWSADFGYREFYSGNCWIFALWNFVRAKRAGYKFVSLHWR